MANVKKRSFDVIVFAVIISTSVIRSTSIERQEFLWQICDVNTGKQV